MNENKNNEIWLEVSNVRIQGTSVSVQLSGDKADQEAVWWPVAMDPEASESADKAYRSILEGLDKKRRVIASLQPIGELLQVKFIRIQFADSGGR